MTALGDALLAAQRQEGAESLSDHAPRRRQNGNALAGDGNLRCKGTGQVWLGSQGPYSIPGEAYAPCLGCADCVCSYCDDSITHRVSWTEYGGAIRTKKVCDNHAARVRGQRGVRVERVTPITLAVRPAEKQGPCRLCGAPPPNELHHLISRGAGLGDDVADNLVPLCAGCHDKITLRNELAMDALIDALTPEEWAYFHARRR